MSDKNEFARCVPAMFQESAVNWLLDKFSADMEEYRLICVENPERLHSAEGGDCYLLFLEQQATLRANAARDTLLCLFSEAPDQCADESIVSESISLQECTDKSPNNAVVRKCHTGSR